MIVAVLITVSLAVLLVWPTRVTGEMGGGLDRWPKTSHGRGPSPHPPPRTVAQEFIRDLANRNHLRACTNATVPGGFLNPCVDRLERWPEVTQVCVDVGAEAVVTGVRISADGHTALVASEDVVPEPDGRLDLTLTMKDGVWRVRVINGRTIPPT